MTATIKVDNVLLLTAKQVAEQFLNNYLEADEYIHEAEWDDDTVEVIIRKRDEDDKRYRHPFARGVSITLADIRLSWVAADYYTIVRDEDGEKMLACFGC